MAYGWMQPEEPENTNGHGHTNGTPHQGNTTPYGHQALDRELQRLANAHEGVRNETLNDAAFNVAQLVDDRHINAQQADQALTDTARGVGLTDTEIRKTLQSASEAAHRKPRSNTPDPDAEPTGAPQPRVLRVDDTPDFWAARPELTHIRDFALARIVSPWAVLSVVLTRIAAATPPTVRLPPIIAGHASLNLFVALVGQSGEGKSGAITVSRDAVQWGANRAEPFTEYKLGSGQGIAHGYMHRVNGELEQHTTSCLFTVQEVDELAGLSQQRGSATLLPELRQVWMGEQLGYLYVDKDKRLLVPQHTYRAGLIVGVQPQRAGVLLNDTDGGTPQRFLWLPVTYPHGDAPPAQPEPWHWTPPERAWFSLPVCETARTEITNAHLERQRGNSDAADGHQLLQQEKVAALLGILNEHAEVTDEDWQLAARVITVSDRCRQWMQNELQAAYDRDNTTRGKQEAKRATIVDDARHEQAVHKASVAVERALRNADEAGLTYSELYRAIRRHRDSCAEALERLIAAGSVTTQQAGGDDPNAQGWRYWWVAR